MRMRAAAPLAALLCLCALLRRAAAAKWQAPEAPGAVDHAEEVARCRTLYSRAHPALPPVEAFVRGVNWHMRRNSGKNAAAGAEEEAEYVPQCFLGHLEPHTSSRRQEQRLKGHLQGEETEEEARHKEDHEQSVHCFPEIIIPGAQKAGTTLMRNLFLLSDCYASPLREPRFFHAYAQGAPVRGEIAEHCRDDYLAWFRVPAPLQAVNRRPIFIDKSPRYLNTQGAAQLAARVLPHTTISIVLLREPIARLFSQFLMSCHGDDTLRLATPVEDDADAKVLPHLCLDSASAARAHLPACPAATNRAWKTEMLRCTAHEFDVLADRFLMAFQDFNAKHPGNDQMEEAAWRLWEQGTVESSLIRNSLYAPQLLEWVRNFPRDRTLVLFHEDFAVNPLDAWPMLNWFAGFPAGRNNRPTIQHRVSRLNTTYARYHRTSSEPLHPLAKTRTKLHSMFFRYNLALAEMLFPALLPASWSAAGSAKQAKALGTAETPRQEKQQKAQLVVELAIPHSELVWRILRSEQHGMYVARRALR